MRAAESPQMIVSTDGPALCAPASIQMAIDMHLATRADFPDGAIFRLFRMTPPAVTIGRHQKWRRVIDPEACAACGWDWARRPTGGGALLHKDEINYAIVVPRGLLSPCGSGEFRAVFELIGHALAASLYDMGLDSELHVGQRTESRRQHGLCGRSITGNEVVHAGAKLVAAAQLVTPERILQHGTVYIKAPGPGDRFWPMAESSAGTAESTQRWSEIGAGGSGETWQDHATRFEAGFRRHFTVGCHPCGLASLDWNAVGAILDDWGSRDWDHNR